MAAEAAKPSWDDLRTQARRGQPQPFIDAVEFEVQRLRNEWLAVKLATRAEELKQAVGQTSLGAVNGVVNIILSYAVEEDVDDTEFNQRQDVQALVQEMHVNRQEHYTPDAENYGLFF